MIDILDLVQLIKNIMNKGEQLTVVVQSNQDDGVIEIYTWVLIENSYSK